MFIKQSNLNNTWVHLAEMHIAIPLSRVPCSSQGSSKRTSPSDFTTARSFYLKRIPPHNNLSVIWVHLTKRKAIGNLARGSECSWCPCTDPSKSMSQPGSIPRHPFYIMLAAPKTKNWDEGTLLHLGRWVPKDFLLQLSWATCSSVVTVGDG